MISAWSVSGAPSCRIEKRKCAGANHACLSPYVELRSLYLKLRVPSPAMDAVVEQPPVDGDDASPGLQVACVDRSAICGLMIGEHLAYCAAINPLFAAEKSADL